jgi:type VI protein secretion system component VasK
MSTFEGEVQMEPTIALEGASDELAATRRARFREALSSIATNSTADDLIRWMLVPASILVILGFNFMLWGWIGAAHTHRQIEQIPYLISGGVIGLGLVLLGGLLLASTFWVAVMRKVQAEAEARAQARIAEVEASVAEVQAQAAQAAAANGQAPRKRAARTSGRTVKS